MLDRLLDIIRPLEGMAVGFSGGVDSSVVVAAAVQALGPEHVLAVTADSPTMPAAELASARELATQMRVPHSVIQTHELDCAEFAANGPDRCYHCKNELWTKVREEAAARGIQAIADGVNSDDLSDHRPGITASDKAGVMHPLALIGAGKGDVRSLARSLSLPNWDKPAQACLSSRFPYGEAITAEGLERVEKAEVFLRRIGLGQLRVRSHSGIARIEVPADLLTDVASSGKRGEIVRRFKEFGFSYVTLDLEGFRSGSMNETLPGPVRDE